MDRSDKVIQFLKESFYTKPLTEHENGILILLSLALNDGIRLKEENEVLKERLKIYE